MNHQQAIEVLSSFWHNGSWKGVTKADSLQIDKAFKVLRGEPLGPTYQYRIIRPGLEANWVEISKSDYDHYIQNPWPGCEVQIKPE